MRVSAKTLALVITGVALASLVIVSAGLAAGDKQIVVTGTGGTGRAQSPDRWALVVGVNDYERPDITKLNYAVADAQAVYSVLTNPDIGGFMKSNVKLMTSTAEGDLRPKKTNISFWLGWLKEHVTQAGLVVIYFSGHGITDKDTGESYLVPEDGDLRNSTTLQDSSVSVARVREILKGLACQRLVLFLDACRNDPVAGKGTGDNPLTDKLARGLALDGEGRGTFYSCKVGERSYEWAAKSQGVFSYFVCDGLTGKAADSKGNVTLASLSEYVTKGVSQWAKDNSKSMTPWLEFQGTPTFVLSHGEPPRAKLRIETEPTKAKVAVVTADGEADIGRSPKDISPGDETSFTIKVSKPGCQAKTVPITVEPGEERTVTVRLFVTDQAAADTDTASAGGEELPVKPVPDRDNPNPPAVTAKYPFRLNNPMPGDTPVRTVVLMGEGPPGTTVQYTINWTGQGLDPKITGDNLSSGQIKVESALKPGDPGFFQSESVSLVPPPDSGVRRVSGYNITVECMAPDYVEGPAVIRRQIAGNWVAPPPPTKPVSGSTPPVQMGLPWQFLGIVMDARNVPGATKPTKRTDPTKAIVGGLLGGLFGNRGGNQPRVNTEALVAAAVTSALLQSSQKGDMDLYVQWEKQVVKVTVDDHFNCGSDVGPVSVRELKPGDVIRVDVAERLGDTRCTAGKIFLIKRPGGLFNVTKPTSSRGPSSTPVTVMTTRDTTPTRQPVKSVGDEGSSDRNWRAVAFRADAVQVQGKDMAAGYFLCPQEGKVFRVFCNNKTNIVAGPHRRNFTILGDGTLVDIKGMHMSELDIQATTISVK